MKLVSNNAPVQVSGGGPETSFSIAMNAKAFRVLSDSLYQNKIGSIVREISCNALDGHIMAGKADVPFAIHLPDEMEPWFAVQDFGTGLTPDAIINVFTKYFESTKDDSNTTVGAFGLGAKSPFSYTDQFTVTSVTGGVKRMYSAYITESGVPSIVEMDSSPTTEGNGVEIKLSAKRDDYRKFANEVSSQLRFFKVKPTILNRASFEFASLNKDIVVLTDNISIANSGSGMYVIQGNVGYLLDTNQISEKLDTKDKDLINALYGSQVCLYFDIGEIGVTASREGLEYNALTIASMKKKLALVRPELTAYINDKMKELTTDYDRALFLNSAQSVNRLARASGIQFANLKADRNNTFHFDFSDLLLDKANVDAFNRPTKLGTVARWSSYKKTRDFGVGAIITPKPHDATWIVLRDINNRGNMRAKQFMAEKNATLLEISAYDTALFTDAFIASLVDALGGCTNIKRLSEVELPKHTTVSGRIRNAYSRPTFYSWNEDAKNSEINIRSWEREFDDLKDYDDDVAYVVVEDMSIVKNSDAKNIHKFAMLSKLDENTLPLVAIRASDLKKIEGLTNFKPFAEYLEGAVKAFDTPKNRLMYRNDVIGGIFQGLSDELTNRKDFMKALETYAPESKLYKVLMFKERMTAKLKELDSDELDSIGELLGFDADAIRKKYSDRINKCFDSTMDAYPFLYSFTHWYTRDKVSAEHAAKYVAAM